MSGSSIRFDSRNENTRVGSNVYVINSSTNIKA